MVDGVVSLRAEGKTNPREERGINWCELGRKGLKCKHAGTRCSFTGCKLGEKVHSVTISSVYNELCINIIIHTLLTAHT